ncbi:MAG TPA: hypothetical protein VIR58_02720 [Acidimicrobiales bacterium]
MPAGALIVLLLGAIAFDMSVVFLRQREATSLAVALANDIATAALDEDHFRGTGEYRIDPELARTYGLELSAASDLADHLLTVEVDVIAADTVQVRLQARAEYVFARSMPGTDDGTTVEASATASADSG